MDPETYARIAALYLEAEALEGDARAEFLDGACEGDVELRAEVEALFAVAESGTAPIPLFSDARIAAGREARDRPTSSEHLVTASGNGDGEPTRIGPYRVIRHLGTGGMGIVYEGESDFPKRRVALKLTQPGPLAQPNVERFEREAAILARLQHPAIAQLYDFGTVESPRGPRPYFALELVEGTDLRTHVVREDLRLEARLELVALVCDAIHYAHERGIVHRDLKPENVMVDRQGRPKVLDFGVARVVDEDASIGATLTRTGQVIGTLSYMAPEQLAADPALITPLADVYALGSIAFELVAGKPPHSLAGLTPAQGLRIIAERDATRLDSVVRETPADVVTIVGRALEREPDRRYASAAALAADLRRFLANEPITARPPSRIYRARKFARRHRGLVAGTTAAALALIVGTLVAVGFAIEASRQRDLALDEGQRAYRSGLVMTGVQLSDLMTKEGQARFESIEALYSIPEGLRGFEWHLVAAQHPRPLLGRQPETWYGPLLSGKAIGAFVATEPECILAVVDGRLQAWDLRGAPLEDPAPDLDVSYLATSTGSKVAVATLEGDVWVLDLSTGERQLVEPGAGETVESVNALALDRTGQSVAFVAGNVLHLRHRGESRVLRLGSDVPIALENVLDWQLQVSDSGSRLIVTNDRTGGGRDISSIDMTRGVVSATIETDWGYYSHLDRRRPRILVPTKQGIDLLDSRTLTPAGRFAEYPNTLQGVFAQSADGSTFGFRTMDAVLLYDSDGEECAAIPHGMRPEVVRGGDVRLSRDGRTALVTGPLRQRLLLMDVDAGSEVRIIENQVESRWIYQLAISPDGDLVATSAPDEESIRVWNAWNGELVREFPRGIAHLTANMEGYLAFSADGERLAAVSSSPDGDLAVLAWDLRTGHARVDSGPFEDRHRSVLPAFLAELGEPRRRPLNARTLVLGDGDTVIGCYDSGKPRAGLWTHTLSGAAPPEPPTSGSTAIALDPTGRRIACGHETGFDVYDLATGEPVRSSPPLASVVQGLAYSPDGTRIAAGCNDGRVTILDAETLVKVLAFQAHEPRPPYGFGYVSAVAWTPDGGRLISASGSGRMRVWTTEDARTHRERAAQVRERFAR